MNYAKYTKKELISMLVKETAISVDSPSKIVAPVIERLKKIQFQEVESFVVITLDSSHKIIDMYVTSTGTVNRTLVHPREVFRHAIADNSVAVIIAHNHPSGNLTPSNEDMDITKRLKQAGKIIGIQVLDHIIVAPNLKYFSMLENEMM